MHRRILEEPIGDWLQHRPAVMIVGARSVGKTTLAKELARSVINLEQSEQADALASDMDGGLRRRDEPILIDEWQKLPDVMLAVKCEVDRLDSANNRFILTGSHSAQLDSVVQTAAGRVQRFRMYPMTVAERKGIPTKPLFDRVVDGTELIPSAEDTLLEEYLHWAVCGGYPDVLGWDEPRALAFMQNYLNDLLRRDIPQITKRGVREASFRLYIQAFAAHTMTSSAHSDILDEIKISYPTGDRYAEILRHLYLTEQLDPWHNNQLKRLVKTRRNVMIDSSLLATIMGWGSQDMLENGKVKGKMMETFVVSQLLAEAKVSKVRPRLFYFREHSGGREIDLLVEIGGRRLIGIEIKTTSTPSFDDGKHLSWFRDQFPDRFLAGVVLHMGKLAFRLGDKIMAVPISTLWSGQQ